MIEGGLYHVYNRFARGEDVFADPEEAVEFADLLREVKQRDGLTVFAWALLSNHFHVALRTSAVPLSRTMQYVQGTFSRRFNRRWRRTGPLWQSRYQARVIDNQDYFDQVTRVPGSKILRSFHSWFRGGSTGLPLPSDLIAFSEPPTRLQILGSWNLARMLP